MSKFIKTLIIINGILIPLILIFVFVNIVKDMGTKTSDVPDGINIENLTVNKKGDSIALQGISYQTPIRISNTNNYLMAISPKTYEEPEIKNDVSMSLLDVRDNSGCYLNFVFLDADYNCIGKLIDKKASIKYYLIPENEDGKQTNNIRNIAYLISFNDTNKDGILNGLDNHDLYLSSISGSDLTKVTDNMDIVDLEFTKNNTELFIAYREIEDKRDEYKNNKFAVYHINSHQLELLKSIDKTINEVTTILNKDKK